MKKIISRCIVITIVTLIINSATHCALPRTEKLQQNDRKAALLTQNIELKMKSIQNATTPEEQQLFKNELANDIEQATTYFDSVQNFFGYGPLAERRRMQAEKQKSALEHKLAQEEMRYKTLATTQAKEKSLKKQNNLKNKIHTEKIALGQAWSWKQKALLGTLAAATAYVGYQYGGTMFSAAKEWWNGEPQQPIVETPPTISEQFTEKFTQLKERGKELQQTTTEKIKSYLTPSVDQQAAQLAQNAKKRLQWAAQERRNTEQARQELIARARQSEEKKAQQLKQRKYAKQQREITTEQANRARLERIEERDQIDRLYRSTKNPYQAQIDQRAKDIRIHEHLKTQNLPPQQLKEYKQYLESLNLNEIPSTKTQKLTVPSRSTSYNPEIENLLPLGNITPEEQTLQTQQYENYKKALEQSKKQPKSWYERIFGGL